MNDRRNPDLFEDYQDATEHQQELDERAEYEEAMRYMTEWELGLKHTNDFKELKER